MNLGRSRYLRIFAVAVFFGFQTVQSFHRHRSVTAEDNCAVCQIVHHTPATSAPVATSVPAVFHAQPLLAVAATPNVFFFVAETALPRAPPVA